MFIQFFIKKNIFWNMFVTYSFHVFLANTVRFIRSLLMPFFCPVWKFQFNHCIKTSIIYIYIYIYLYMYPRTARPYVGDDYRAVTVFLHFKAQVMWRWMLYIMKIQKKGNKKKEILFTNSTSRGLSVSNLPLLK